MHQSARGLEELLRQLIRDEVRAALADALGDGEKPGADDGELRVLAAEQAAKFKRARATGTTSITRIVKKGGP